jgi:small neutral amino acid transporter SnatA (MarC family)
VDFSFLQFGRQNLALYCIVVDAVRAAAGPPFAGARRTRFDRSDIAISPLAIPLLSGPGTITTILPLANHARANLSLIWTLALVSAAVYLIKLVHLINELLRQDTSGKADR